MPEAYKWGCPLSEDDMQPMAARTTLISGAALVWGTMELVALQWSRFVERYFTVR